MNIQDKIKSWIKETLNTESDFVLEYPMQMSHGDYSTNVALIESKKQGKNPKDLAQEFAEKLDENKISEIEKIEVAGPGFINFFLKPEVFSNIIDSSIKSGNDVGKSEKLKGQKIIVEYTDPNPFKEFHIGHLMSNTIGEAISRTIAFSGAEVKRACYQGDVGLHVAYAIWGMEQLKYNPNMATPNELGKAYAFGAQAMKDSLDAQKEIVEINKKIFSRDDEEINKIYDAGRKISLEYFEGIYKTLGTHFDFYFFESKTGTFGKEIVEKNIGTIFEKSDGAIIFKGENYDSSLHTRVFINKDGLPTYEAKELGLSKIKYDTYEYTKSIVITGNEINDYFRVLLKAMSLVFPDLASKTKHISHGMLRLPEGKMSSRTGKVVTAISLMDEVRTLVLEKMKEREMSQDVKDDIAEQIAIGSLKYSILKQTIGKDIIFDLEKSVSFEGDSGPYLQYATVRANSILKKANGVISLDSKIPEGWQTTDLEKIMERFESVVSRAGEEYAPHYIVTYLIQLAGEFNSFYAKHKIIDDKDSTSAYKLAINQSFVNTMTSGLTLLGIKVPEEM